MRVAGLVVTALLIVVLGWYGARFLAFGSAVIRYPLPLGYGEGHMLSLTKLLMAGQPIYRALDNPPYILAPYPPVYHLMTWGVDLFVKHTLAAGRIISTASTLLIAVVLGCLTWRAVGPGSDALPRGLAAGVGGMTFFSITLVQRWGRQMHVDMLALLFALVGVLAFVTWVAHPRKVYWSLLFFVLAGYTKQSALAAPLACLLVAMIARPRLGLRLGAALAAGGLGIFALINFLTGGQFYFHLVTANTLAYDWRIPPATYATYLRYYPAFFAACVLTAIWFFKTGRLTVSSWRSSAGRDAAVPEEFRWDRPVLGVYLITAFVGSLAVGRAGASSHYMIEFMAVVSACVGIATAWPAAALASSRPGASYQRWGAAILAVLLPTVLLLQVARPGRLARIELPSPAERLTVERVLSRIRQTDGPVFAENMGLLAVAGKPAEFDPFSMTQLSYRGLWDQRKFLQKVDSKWFDLVVLEFDTDADPRPAVEVERFSPEMVAALRHTYRLTAVEGNFRVYQPR